MKRPVVLVVGAAAAAFVLAAAGASAHTAWLDVTRAGTQALTFGDEASGARTESPEPTEPPEATPTAKPTERPEPTEAAEPPEVDQQPGDGGGASEDQGEDQGSQTTSTGHHDGDAGHGGSGGDH
jgi:hypothetical protein